MLRAEDMGDQFWSVRERESAEEKSLRRAIASVDAQIEVIKRKDLIKHAPGFQDFVKSIETLHRDAREKLIGDEKLTDAGLREQRGRVKGLEQVLALLLSPQEENQLAERRKELQNALDAALQRRPKPKEVSTP